jgi:hypothetical protein
VGSLAVKGKVTHKDGVALLSIGKDTVVPAADGSFTHVVQVTEGANVVEIQATSKSGKKSSLALGVQAGTFLAPGQIVTDAAAARVTNEALKAAAPVAGDALEKNIRALSGKQVGQWVVAPLGHRIVTTVDVGAVKVKDAIVDVQGKSTGLFADLTLKQLDITVEVEVDAGSFLGKSLKITEQLPVHFDTFSADGLVSATIANKQVVVDAKNLNVDYSPAITSKIIGQSNLSKINAGLAGISKIIPGNPKLTIDEVAIVNKLLDLIWQHGLKKTADDKIATLIQSKARAASP